MATPNTICFTGMDSADADRLKGLFAEANQRVGNLWTLTTDTDADMLVVDVDSMYGHMAWLKLHNAARVVVALSSSGKADADHLLQRPVTVDALATLLAEQGGTTSHPAKSADEARPAASAAITAVPSAKSEPVSPGVPAMPAPAPAPAPAPVAAVAPAPVAAPTVEPPAPARDPMLGDYLQADALPGPVRFQLGDAPPLVLDPQSRTYLGPAALKGFVPYAKAVIRKDDWTAITPHELDRLKVELGGTQPYARLQWLAALVGSDGKIAPGYDPNQKFTLVKWPQIEREFPKHFRIATAMMKGPQLLTEIADGSTVPLAEVTDFVNANLATGMAEMEAPLSSADQNAAAGKGGLLGRLRGR